MVQNAAIIRKLFTDSPAERSAALDMKVAASMKAQKAGQVGSASSPEFHLTAIMALASVHRSIRMRKRTPPLYDEISAEAVRLLSEAKTTLRMRKGWEPVPDQQERKRSL